MNIFQNTEVAFQHKTNTQLKKAKFLFQCIQNPILTKIGNSMLGFLVEINFPFVKSIVKNTIFEQFCGGESRKECLPVIDDLYKNKVHSILDYSVEGKEDEKIFDQTCEEIISIIQFSEHNASMPFTVFKPTGFGRFALYEKVNQKQLLNEEETAEWKRVLNRFERVANEAKKANITIMIDAEESWIQDAIDTIAEDLMRKYNVEKCIICNTLQMYRHDRLTYLKSEYKKAKEGNYFVGYKIVRGAYMEKERKRATEMNYISPIQNTKEETDMDYNKAIDFAFEHKETISLFAGTHNEKSCQLLINRMNEFNLNKDFHKIWFGQLFGMSDNLSFNLAKNGYNVAKYLPYGPIKEVIPYLMRRATENTSVAGQTGRELELLKQEIIRRKL